MATLLNLMITQHCCIGIEPSLLPVLAFHKSNLQTCDKDGYHAYSSFLLQLIPKCYKTGFLGRSTRICDESHRSRINDHTEKMEKSWYQVSFKHVGTHKPKPIMLNLTGILTCLYLSTISFQGKVLLFFFFLLLLKQKKFLHPLYISVQNIQKSFDSSLCQLYIGWLRVHKCTETPAKTSNKENSSTQGSKGQESVPDLSF